MGMTYASPDADRRRGLRIAQTRSVKVFYPAAERYFPAETLDLSPSGLRLSLPPSTPFLPGSLLHLHVASAGSNSLASRRSMIPARVVWVDRSNSSALHAGVEFVSAASRASVNAA